MNRAFLLFLVIIAEVKNKKSASKKRCYFHHEYRKKTKRDHKRDVYGKYETPSVISRRCIRPCEGGHNKQFNDRHTTSIK